VLVYGDHREIADPRDRLQALAFGLPRIANMPAGIERHTKLASALVETGQLVQGVADAGADAGPLEDFLHALAAAFVRSADTHYQQIGELPVVTAMPLPTSVELKLPEGFAFYAVYPEAYIDAARRLALSGAPRVIGIRSIGTTLGAVVAAALDAPKAITVRPFGDPFARRVELPDAIIDRDAHYLIVDEGPGLSGSSFGGVADWLEHRGVPLERIAFLPSHAGEPGPQASARHRRRWRDAQRSPANFNARFLDHRFGPLEAFHAGGAWQRQKYLGVRGATRVLLKFAGIGAIGERKLEMARALHAAGFVPEPFGLVHGFLVERWCDDAQPLAARDKPVEEVGRYIGARARLFPAGEDSGASIAELLTMCRRNIGLALGDDHGRALGTWDVRSLRQRVRRVRTDNKLDAEEWLRLPNGRLLKADAVDHHQAHDLVGCQDLAWDVAGAISEFALAEDEARRLIASSEQASGRSLDPSLLDFYRIAYAAFRLGQASLAMEMDGGDRASRGRYLRQLQLLLQGSARATRRDSLVG
jgi:hypothetical protein